MYLRKRKASTDPVLRSLLQKSVRRGSMAVVEAVVRSLIAIGDRHWVRSRIAVIVFEEAWPLAEGLNESKEDDAKLRLLLSVARATKQKDAAGLGALAFALHSGDETMKESAPEWSTLRVVAEALARPSAFFHWALNESGSAMATRIVTAAQTSLSGATWGWDKATILAGALLALSANSGLSATLTEDDTEGPDLSAFPYWVALDKHTPEGRETLSRIATKYRLKYRQLVWASFYCESAKVNALRESPWFATEQNWRLRRAGLTVDQALEIWSRVRDAVRDDLGSSAVALRERVHSLPAGEERLLV